jgi:protein TonB
MMNGMSYGSGTRSAAPAPPEKSSRQALNLSLPQSDTQAVMGSNFTVKGHIGADYMAELHKWVEEHGYYPDAAAAQGQEGNAMVEFTVDRTGHVTGAHLVQSSGSTFIDQAWLQLFADNALPPFPPGTKANQVTIEYTGEFHLIR